MADSIVTTVSSPDLAKLHATLKAMEGNFQVALRRGLKKAADESLARAKAQSSWSKRIPGSLSTKVSFSSKNAGVKVVANRALAPDARAFEHGGKAGTFRHPVFGRKVYVAQRARPFFYSAFDKAKITQDVTDAIADVLRQAGLT